MFNHTKAGALWPLLDAGAADWTWDFFRAVLRSGIFFFVYFWVQRAVESKTGKNHGVVLYSTINTKLLQICTV